MALHQMVREHWLALKVTTETGFGEKGLKFSRVYVASMKLLRLLGFTLTASLHLASRILSAISQDLPAAGCQYIQGTIGPATCVVFRQHNCQYIHYTF